MKILIVEDDKLHYKPLEKKIQTYLKNKGKNAVITIAATKSVANRFLSNNEYDMAFFDLKLDQSSHDGIDLIEAYRNKVNYPVVLSSQDDMETFKLCKKHGCDKFIKKPADKEAIEILLDRYFSKLDEEEDLSYILRKYITKDQEILDQLKQIPKHNDKNTSIHIWGETGTGKEIVAQKIAHKFISGKDADIISFNCAEINNDPTARSNLFGHKKGSFTGADSHHIGLFELANNGTLFLDEIDKLSYEEQGLLLRVLETKTFRPVGGKEIKSDFLLITASSTNLEELRNKGLFREDLHSRITGTVVYLSPLRERYDDIELQIQYYIDNLPSRKMIEVSGEAKRILNNYHWPDNTRSIIKLVNEWDRRGITTVTPKHLKKLVTSSVHGRFKLLNKNLIEHFRNNDRNTVIEDVSKELVHYYMIKNNYKVNQAVKESNMARTTFLRYWNLLKDGLNVK